MRTIGPVAFAAAVVAQSQYGEKHVTVNFDSQLVEQTAFPTPNVSLYCPAFMKSGNTSFAPGWFRGTEGATSQDELTSFISNLAARNPAWMSFRVADFVGEEGKDFPYVYLSSPRNSSTVNDDSGKLRVWIQGSVHGNEPAGNEATLALLGAMDRDSTLAASFFEVMDIIVLPRYNPDGNAYFQRTLATNFDPNMDHTKLARQQTRDIKKWLNSSSPHIAIDMHKYGAATRYSANYSNAADGMYSAAKNLNIHPDIRELSETVFAPAINASLLSQGLRGEQYMTASRTNPPRLDEAGTDAKIGRNAMGLTQSITFLFENPRDQSEDVYNIIEGAITQVVESTQDIVITDYTNYTNYTNRTWTMVDRRTGAVVQLPLEFASTTPATANLTRPRPKGYIIPRAWSDLAERLRVSGLEVETMDHIFTDEVEVYNITTSSLARSYYEGAILNTVTTEILTREVTLPVGSSFVSSAQKNAGLAFVALEPENIDSYVSFGIVPMEVGDLYPVFRKV
ncbi:Zn-dependent exopeptidase [Setomelanomma holmii]|uniref:Carboxypeptidase M14B n=1 Tax=Setomelanomma holmii TaxID=210430 RepID=A0A9P4GZ77_9PLEO|nr:Zn-dependent exopeptidase [Setomelanomma holmii]